MYVKKRERKFLFIGGACILLAVVIGIFIGMQSGQYDKVLVKQNQDISALANELMIKQAAVGESDSQVIKLATGLDLVRKESDDKIARTLAETVTTWSSYEEYKAMRDKVTADYALQNTSTFMQEFLPARPFGLSTTPDGYACQFSKMETCVTNIAADTYSYFATVKAVASGPSGANKTITTIFLYDINGSGEISNLRAYSVM